MGSLVASLVHVLFLWALFKPGISHNSLALTVVSYSRACTCKSNETVVVSIQSYCNYHLMRFDLSRSLDFYILTLHFLSLPASKPDFV